jgi:hypothetical protein
VRTSRASRSSRHARPQRCATRPAPHLTGEPCRPKRLSLRPAPCAHSLRHSRRQAPRGPCPRRAISWPSRPWSSSASLRRRWNDAVPWMRAGRTTSAAAPCSAPRSLTCASRTPPWPRCVSQSPRPQLTRPWLSPPSARSQALKDREAHASASAAQLERVQRELSEATVQNGQLADTIAAMRAATERLAEQAARTDAENANLRSALANSQELVAQLQSKLHVAEQQLQTALQDVDRTTAHWVSSRRAARLQLALTAGATGARGERAEAPAVIAAHRPGWAEQHAASERSGRGRRGVYHVGGAPAVTATPRLGASTASSDAPASDSRIARRFGVAAARAGSAAVRCSGPHGAAFDSR